MLTRKILSLGLIIILLSVSTNAPVAGEVSNLPRASDELPYLMEIERWRAERLEEINGEGGWTSVVGLFWLKDGQNRLGSDPSNDIVLPPGPAPKFAGSLVLEKGVVRLEAISGASITSEDKPASTLTLQTDADGKATVLNLGSLTMFVIKRGEKLGLRVKDKQNQARAGFAGLDFFPIEQKWRLEARLDAYNPPKIVPIANVLGMIDNMTSPGTLVFRVDRKTYRLDPVLEKGSKKLFIMFSDKTAGTETYGAGRYLYVDPPGRDGKVIVDFNKAHNPPCAFTQFATCPLPPVQNRLPIRIVAGEKKYVGAGH